MRKILELPMVNKLSGSYKKYTTKQVISAVYGIDKENQFPVEEMKHKIDHTCGISLTRKLYDWQDRCIVLVRALEERNIAIVKLSAKIRRLEDRIIELEEERESWY